METRLSKVRGRVLLGAVAVLVALGTLTAAGVYGLTATHNAKDSSRNKCYNSRFCYVGLIA